MTNLNKLVNDPVFMEDFATSHKDDFLRRHKELSRFDYLDIWRWYMGSKVVL